MTWIRHRHLLRSWSSKGVRCQRGPLMAPLGLAWPRCDIASPAVPNYCNRSDIVCMTSPSHLARLKAAQFLRPFARRSRLGSDWDNGPRGCEECDHQAKVQEDCGSFGQLRGNRVCLQLLLADYGNRLVRLFPLRQRVRREGIIA